MVPAEFTSNQQSVIPEAMCLERLYGWAVKGIRLPRCQFFTGNANADQSPYVLLSSNASLQNDILLCIKDLWKVSAGIPNSATDFYNNHQADTQDMNATTSV
jgi:hypothetical protein